jgi:hypothetical protein
MIRAQHSRQTAPARAMTWIAAAVLATAANFAVAQEEAGEPPAPPVSAEPQAQPPRAQPTGVLQAIGRLVDDSIATVKSGIGNIGSGAGDIGEQAGDAVKDTASAAQDAATSVVRIPTTGVVTGRQRCLRAPNGGPDCRAAIQTLCQKKGYASGRSLDVQSAEKCPARVLLSGRQAAAGECTMETYVTRAVCQ